MRLAGSMLILLGAMTAPAVPALAASYDGSWQVEITTEKGGCDQLYRYYVVIEDGQVRVRSMSGQLGQPAGRIADNGRIASRIGTPNDPVDIEGRLRREGGGGTWEAPYRGCSGVWRAARR